MFILTIDTWIISIFEKIAHFIQRKIGIDCFTISWLFFIACFISYLERAILIRETWIQIVGYRALLLAYLICDILQVRTIRKHLTGINRTANPRQGNWFGVLWRWGAVLLFLKTYIFDYTYAYELYAEYGVMIYPVSMTILLTMFAYVFFGSCTPLPPAYSKQWQTMSPPDGSAKDAGKLYTTASLSQAGFSFCLLVTLSYF